MTRRKEPKRPHDRRGKNPNSLKTLRPPIKAGEVRNPFGINAKTPITASKTYAGLIGPLPFRRRVIFSREYLWKSASFPIPASWCSGRRPGRTKS